MNKKLLYSLILVLSNYSTYTFCCEVPKKLREKALIKSCKLQHEFNNFWSGLSPKTQQIIHAYFTVHKDSYTEKQKTINTRKIKRGIYQCLPFLVYSIIGSYSLHKSYQIYTSDNGTVKSLITALTLSLHCIYNAKQYTPTLLNGCTSLWNGIFYKNHRESTIQAINQLEHKVAEYSKYNPKTHEMDTY